MQPEQEIDKLTGLEREALRKLLREGVLPHLGTLRKFCQSGLIERCDYGYQASEGVMNAMKFFYHEGVR